MPRIAKGVQQTPWGYRTYVRVKGFPLKTKRWKRHATLEDMKLWRERARAKLILQKDRAEKKHIQRGTFRGDALTYLQTVTAMPTYKERVKHIHEWIALFGDTLTDDITPAEIRAQRDRWLTVGPRTMQRKGKVFIVHKPLAASSVNHRLRALENMWTVLWPGTPNLVRQVPEVHEPTAAPRNLTRATLEKVFAALPEGKTKARLAVMRWTGLPHKTLGRIRREHVDLRRALVWVPGREKGQGTEGRTLPLLPEAVAAWRAFIKARAFGEFSASGMHSVFQRACLKAKLPPLTPYQLRHSFGTLFLAATDDLRATQRALGHSTSKLTERYAQGAVEPALRAAYARVAKVTRLVARKVATRRMRP